MKIILCVLTFCITVCSTSYATESLSYSGRLVNTNGSPVAGPVNLKAELAYSNAPTVVLCSQDFTNVALSNGVFHLKIDFDCGSPVTLSQVLAQVPVNESAAIKITDVTHSKSYSYQALHSMPFANIAETAKQVVQMGASDGQVLKWNNTTSKWEPGAVGSGNGSVTSVASGTGLTGGPITTTGTLSIANGGVGTTQLADGSVTNLKVAAGIARAKLAAGSADHVLVNDGTGFVSSVAEIAITQGGTGANTAANARINLGLGLAAVADIGMSAGNVMSASLVPLCLPTEKLQMSLGPTYIWSCVPDNNSDATKLALTGGTMSGAINMGSNSITNLGAPSSSSDAATKSYVDTQVGTLTSSQWTTAGSDIHRATGKVGVGTTTPGSTLDVKGTLYLSGSTSGHVGFAPAAVAGATTYTLPSADGSAGQLLKTNGAGVLSWVTDDSGAGAFSGTINKAVATDGAGALTTVITTSTELDYVAGVTSGIQAQLNAKQATINKTTVQDVSKLRIYGANATNYVELSATTLTANRLLNFPDSNGTSGNVLSTDGSGNLSWVAIPSSPVTSVFGRTGVVAATAGDYTGTQVTNTAAGNISATNVQTAINELDTEKQNISTFAADVRAVALTGLSTATNAVITATDSVLVSFGKLQAQISGQTTSLATKADLTNISQTITAAAVTGLNAPSVGADATNKTYVDAQIAGAGNQWTLSSGNVYRLTGNVGVGTATPGSALDVKGVLRLSGSTSGYVGFAPAAAAGSITYTLPSADGSAGQILKTNGSGVLSWVTDNSGAGAFTGTLNRLVLTDGSTGALATSTVTNTEAGYLSGVTSAIQTQLDAKQVTINKTTVQDVSKLRIYGANATNYVELSAATLTANRLLNFPDSNGASGNVLSTDGSGNLSWVPIASAPVSSVFGRTGAVVATAGDYTATQVTNTAAGNISATTAQAAINELDTEKQNVSTFAADVRAVVLTGLSTATNAAITAADSVLVAFGKLQAQITGQGTTLATKADLTNIAQTITAANVTGLTGPVAGADATNKTYVDAQIAGAGNQWTLSSGNVYRLTGNVGVGTATPGSALDVKGTLRLSGSSSGYVGFAPAAAAGSVTYTLPIADGSAGQILKTNGSGVLSWVTDNSGAGAFTGTINKAVVTDGAGALATSATSSTELGYVAGVTSAIQTQLNAKQSTSLNSTNILVGNGSNIATAVAMSGDATLANTGAITLKNTGTAGTYKSVTTDAQGRVTAGTNPTTLAGFGITDTLVNSVSVTAPVTNTGTAAAPIIGMPLATTAVNGYLAATDWTIFNNKQATISKTTVQDVSKLRIYGANATNYVELTAATLTANRTLSFPDSNGTSGQVLSTNGAGILSWISPAGSVTSVFSRTGAVVAAAGDYTGAQVTNTASGNIAATTVQAAINELDTEKQNISTFAADVRAVVLTGLSTATNAAITAADSVLVSFGKLQAQISGQATSLSTKADLTNISQTITAAAVTGLTGPIAGADAANKTYVDAQIASAGSKWTATGGDIYRASGNVGIGTTTPGAPLEVQSSASEAVRIKATSSGNSAQATIQFKDSTNALIGALGDSRSSDSNMTVGAYAGSLLFDTATQTRMTITAAGSIGIGTSAPGAGLDIATTGTSSAIIVPRDTVANRPSTPVNGMIRYASDTNKLEAYQNNTWTNIVSGGSAYSLDASDGAPTQALYVNAQGDISIGASRRYLFAGATETVTNAVFASSSGAGSFQIGGCTNATCSSAQTYTNFDYAAGVASIYNQKLSLVTPGSAAAPAFYLNGESTTGLFRPAANSLAFSMSGAEKIRIDSSGNLGLGTTTPGAPLDVKGAIRMSGSTSGFTGFQPAAAAGGTVWTLPIADGTTGQVLSTNGSGIMSWVTAGGAVSSVFSRTGAVVAVAGDYTATQVTNTAAGNIAATNVQTAINELDTEKQNISTFAADVRAVVLTGLSTATNAVITATDSVLVAFGKLQAQISAHTTSLAAKADLTNISQTITAANVTGLTGPIAGADAANKTYVDAQVATAGSKWTTSGSDIYRPSGNVGIGTATPGANTKLNVNGQITASSSSTTTGVIDFVGGNSVTTTYDCGANLTLANIRDGGNYIIVVTGTGTTQCSFGTSTTGDGAATVTYRFAPINDVRTGNTHTVYNLSRVGNIVYVSWVTGF